MHGPSPDWDVHLLESGRPFVDVELNVVELLAEFVQEVQVGGLLGEFAVLCA